MPAEPQLDENGERVCPSCESTSLVSKSDRRGNTNYFCTNCGWALLGGVEYPVEKKDPR